MNTSIDGNAAIPIRHETNWGFIREAFIEIEVTALQSNECYATRLSIRVKARPKTKVKSGKRNCQKFV